MRRPARFLALALCGLLALSGCGAPPPEPTPTATPAPTPTQAPTPVRFSLSYEPAASLHPITGESAVNQELTGLVYQGLYELDNAFTPQPVLAKSASVGGEGLVWTFTLAAVAFSDGTPLTAQHAAASLNAARSSPLYAARLSSVTAVAAGEGDTLTVTLSAPNGNLPALLDIPIVLEQADAPAPLGTGYYCYEREGEDGLALRPNPHHAGPRPPYDAIPLTPTADAGARIAAFDSGEVACVTTDFTSPYALGYSGSCEVCDYPTTTLLYVGFQTVSGPCRTPEVRRALSRAFDREGLAEAELSAHADPAALPISPLGGEYDGDAAGQLSYDMEAAGQLLDEAGYPLNEEDKLRYDRRTPLALTLVVNGDNGVRAAAAARLAQSLGSLGITVTVERLSWKDYAAALAAGRFDLYLGEVRLTGDFNPAPLLTGALNYGGFAGEELTALLAQWQAARGSARTQAAKALWTQFAQDAPLAPLCFTRGSLLIRWGMASHLQPTRANPFYRMEEWETG